MKTKIRRILAILIAVILVLVLATLAAGAVAKNNLANKYPAPGKLLDVGGYKMHIYCVGDGSPTVILDAGLMEFSVNWAHVQPEIAKNVRVCSYDRAGYGWSETSSKPRTANTIVDELHNLLVNAKVEGPYVLVGHSLGGLFARTYAHNYPDEVVGMILVDSTHEEQDIRFFAAFPRLIEVQQQMKEQSVDQYKLFGFLSSTGLMAFAQNNIPDPGLPEAAYKQYQARLVAGSYFETGISEFTGLEDMLAEVRSMHISSFGKLPLVVLSAGQWQPDPTLSEAENQQMRALMKAMQSELAALSSNGKQVVVEQSGHNIQSDQPESVIEAILEMVNDLRE